MGQGQKSLPRMTRDAQDICESILSKIRGPGSAGIRPGVSAEEQMQAQLADHWRDQEVVKGKGKLSGLGAPQLLKGMGKGGGKMPFPQKGGAGRGGPPLPGWGRQG